MQHVSKFTGPILILDSIRDGTMTLSALVLVQGQDAPPAFDVEDEAVVPKTLASFGAFTVWRARFTVPIDRPTTYGWNGTRYDIASDLTGPLALAYVSCNGEEHGDLDRTPSERNAMWRRLCDQHRKTPFSLLLHGGDQVYADEATQGHALSEGWPLAVPDAPSNDDLEGLRRHLRDRFARRYGALYADPDIAWLMARVPSVMQWDDHDICDGWGSLPEAPTVSAVGQTLFAVAREAALVFQHACTETDLPSRFADRTARHLGWHIDAPGLRILAPDLRSERTMTRVMGDQGWADTERWTTLPATAQTFLMSSVPLLGPRLSLVEGAMLRLPGVQKYEDDLRDQWQSRAHRDSWVRMLTLVRRLAEQGDVTALSGEIHLATRADMDLGAGRVLHQLVASGIAHRPPPHLWARALGGLAAWGEDPLPDAPIRIRPLPGQRHRYTAERNALWLTRTEGQWSARWDLEHSGPTPSLGLRGHGGA